VERVSDFERLVGLVGLPCALALLAILGLVKGVVVPGKAYQEKVAECEAWKAMALRGTELAEVAVQKTRGTA
jgi:hypothetical protein